MYNFSITFPDKICEINFKGSGIVNRLPIHNRCRHPRRSFKNAKRETSRKRTEDKNSSR